MSTPAKTLNNRMEVEKESSEANTFTEHIIPQGLDLVYKVTDNLCKVSSDNLDDYLWHLGADFTMTCSPCNFSTQSMNSYLRHAIGHYWSPRQGVKRIRLHDNKKKFKPEEYKKKVGQLYGKKKKKRATRFEVCESENGVVNVVVYHDGEWAKEPVNGDTPDNLKRKAAEEILIPTGLIAKKWCGIVDKLAAEGVPPSKKEEETVEEANAGSQLGELMQEGEGGEPSKMEKETVGEDMKETKEEAAEGETAGEEKMDMDDDLVETQPLIE